MSDSKISNTNTISLFKFVSKLPSFLPGMPKRIQGMYLANRNARNQAVGLGVCLELACKRNPTSIALIYEGQEYTYARFNSWVNRIAHSLAAMGTKKGEVIAIFVENRPELLACIAAIAKVGAVSALLNTSQRGRVLRHSIDLVSPTRVIVGEELYDACEDVSECLPSGWNSRLYLPDMDTLSKNNVIYTVPEGWFDFAADVASQHNENPLSTKKSRSGEAFCYFYTSGTTGMPKAAILTHGRYMKAYGGVGLACLQFTKNDRAYVTLPFYHGTALVVAWGSVISGSAGLVIARQFSASKFWPEVQRTKATAICYVGELCRYLLAQPASSEDKNHQVNTIFGNGLRPNLWLEFKNRFGIERVMEFYGSSEGNVGFLNVFNHDCTVGFTTVPYAIVKYDLEQSKAVRGRNGFLRKVKKGDSGLLLGKITANTPFDGYTDPEKTEQTILRNVFNMGDAWFNTGDLMRDQGFNHAQFVDRLGDTYRWKGENVSTTEVENCLNTISQVLDVVVYGVEIPNTNGRAGMASVTINSDDAFDAGAFHRYVVESLPAFAVPVFVRVSQEMEKTGTFKYKKTDLKKNGFDLSLVKEPVWVKLPGGGSYQLMDAEIESAIRAGDFRF